jgi:hypothetical protein
MQNSNPQYTPVVLSASGIVRKGAGQLGGFFCASSSSGTLVLYDNTAASGTIILTTVNLVAGTYYNFPAQLINGAYASIGGTASVTFFYS